jgi:hypothetical protein
MSPNLEVRSKMQAFAQGIESQLPPGWGLALFCFPIDDRDGFLNYVATAKREDIVKMLREFIEHSEKSFGEHADG